MQQAIIDTPIGLFSIKEEQGHITEVMSIHNVQTIPPQGDLLTTASTQIQEYLSGKRAVLNFPIAMQGSKFQKEVWTGVIDIPHGAKMTYSGLAQSIGRPRAARAVGNALNKNNLLLIVPCHRIVAADGGIGGFGCGERMKKQLMQLEGMKL